MSLGHIEISSNVLLILNIIVLPCVYCTELICRLPLRKALMKVLTRHETLPFALRLPLLPSSIISWGMMSLNTALHSRKYIAYIHKTTLLILSQGIQLVLCTDHARLSNAVTEPTGG